MTRRDFLGAGDPGAIDALYRRFLDDPHSVPRDVAREFAAMLEEDLNARRNEADEQRRNGHLQSELNPLDGSRPSASAAPYTGSIGWEFMHLQDEDRRDWFCRQAEEPRAPLDPQRRLWLLDLLIRAEEFERGLQMRLPGEKRFGLEGAESYLVLCEALIGRAAETGVRKTIIGGMHRGRLNILVHLMGKPLRSVIAEIMGRPPAPAGVAFSADVPYHNGYSAMRAFGGRDVHLSLLPHPSHLSVVAPVALGKCRGAQRRLGAVGRREILPLMMHTDAAFAGQGVIAEMLQLSRLAAFSVGGAVHLVLDNQLGFTTAADEGRSTRYCTDVAKGYDKPVLHVNGDDPEAVLRVAQIAADYRGVFHDDIVFVLHAYRRRGHNELDEPRFTQPALYRAIDQRESVVAVYDRQLSDGGIATSREKRVAAYAADFTAEADTAVDYRVNDVAYFRDHWSAYHAGARDEMLAFTKTGVAPEKLRRLGQALTAIPAEFALHPKVARLVEERRDSIDSGEGINWATAELLAFASLAQEGFSVRLGGQDTARGAFAHRHFALYDQNTGAKLPIFSRIDGGAEKIEIFNTPLAEYSVLAFEYGYSLASPETLICWEAQFGDFLNIAQPVMDQFICCGEDRWLRSSGLVLLLPHGMDGGGPDHSTAHPERLLHACAGANMAVVNASTPAQYFHLLRRQMLRPFRKPLALLAPKTLLRHRACVSPLRDFGAGAGFRNVLADNFLSAGRVILCSGKVYYELVAEREQRGLEKRVAIVRLEQLYPLDGAALKAALTPHPNAELVWCQEEPENMGPFRVLDRALEEIAGKRFRYVGRPPAATPAVGVHEWHERERNAVLDAALTLAAPRTSSPARPVRRKKSKR